MTAAEPETSPVEGFESQDSPFDIFWSSVYGSEPSAQEKNAEFAEAQLEREQLLQQCMRRAGFEYEQNVRTSAVFSEDEEWPVSSPDWVRQYGYGIVNYPNRDEPSQSPDNVHVDVNADYIDGLSNAEEAAYYEALYGPPVAAAEVDAAGSSTEWDWSRSGCSGWAENERLRDDPTMSTEHKSLVDAMGAVYNDVLNSREHEEVDSDWARCMTEAGHSAFASPSDAIASIEADFDTFPMVSSVDQGGMAALEQREVALALADLQCKQETNYEGRVEQIQVDVEQRFVDEHEMQLQKLKEDIDRSR